jgi:hypothetical protein
MCVFYIATEPIHVDETTRIAHRQGRMDVPFVAHDALATPVSETVGHLAAIKYTRELLVLLNNMQVGGSPVAVADPRVGARGMGLVGGRSPLCILWRCAWNGLRNGWVDAVG